MKKIDLMTYQELWQLANEINRNPTLVARTLAPHRLRGYVTVVKNVGHYCENRATYLQHPNSIVPTQDSVGSYQDIADHIFSRLPVWARELIR